MTSTFLIRFTLNFIFLTWLITKNDKMKNLSTCDIKDEIQIDEKIFESGAIRRRKVRKSGLNITI